MTLCKAILRCALVCLGLVWLAGSCPAWAAETVTLEVREPHGLGRRAYPINTVIQLPRAVPTTSHFRLLDRGKPVVAHFRPVQQGDMSDRWWLDFTATLAPHEVRRLTLHYGKDVDRGPQRTRGHKLTQRDDALVIFNAPHIHWTVPRDLKGLLRSVDFPPSEHLRTDSPGLLLRDSAGHVHPLGGPGTKVRILRQSPMTVVLRFEKTETHKSLAGVRWQVDLIFPVPVSWVEVVATIDDPENRVAALGMTLHMNLDPPTRKLPTMVDMGAASTVYTSLVGDDKIEMRASPTALSPWQIVRGPADNMQPFAAASQKSKIPAEGWVHVMDSKRCLALAIERFAQNAPETISATADGTISTWKDFSRAAPDAKRPEKTFRTWLHFVHFPPQQSAGASPQVMQHPIQVRVVKSKSK